MTDFDIRHSESEVSESEEELQEAFAKGLIKPGLNEVLEKKTHINLVGELKSKLRDIKQRWPWLETLDTISVPAPLAPELAAQIQEQEGKRANEMKNNKKLPQFAVEDDPILNDFKREMLFHRQAQATVLSSIEKLKKLKIPTRRPDDFFAEMAKTDEHMQKIRENLVKKQAENQRSERVKQLRAQRKMGKAVQVEARLKKAADKKEMLDEIKKFRKGKRGDLNFLNDKKPGGKKGGVVKSKKSMEKEKRKNNKFGFGGKKRGKKLNNRDSAADVSEYRRPAKMTMKEKGGGAAKRPGKNRRVNSKAKSKK